MKRQVDTMKGRKNQMKRMKKKKNNMERKRQEKNKGKKGKRRDIKTQVTGLKKTEEKNDE